MITITHRITDKTAATTLEVDYCTAVTVTGDAGSIATQSGDVNIEGNVGGSVSTMSGDVDCGSIGGSVSTMSGDVKHRR